MDLLQVLGASITFGSALGATVAGFFAYRQKSLVTLLRESNKDYKDRVEQLEEERDSQRKLIGELQAAVTRLEQEKRLPLDKLTKLIIEQHKQSNESIENVTNQLADVAKNMGLIAKAMTNPEKGK